MSELGNIESAVIGLITGITSESTPVFKTVLSFPDPDRKAGVAQVRRHVSPAALVIYAGRLRADTRDAVIGAPRLTILISAEENRGDAQVASQGFDLLEQITTTLDGTLIETDRRLLLLDEQIADTDGTHVVYEQRYVIDRVAELIQPTFDNVALAGTESLVNVVVGDLSTESVAFGFPGIDGEFRHQLGLRGRPIEWQGQLRADDDAAMNTLETQIEDAVIDAAAYTLTDAWGRSFADCVCERFQRNGPRKRHPVTSQSLQSFEIHFVQLNP